MEKQLQPEKASPMQWHPPFYAGMQIELAQDGEPDPRK